MKVTAVTDPAQLLLQRMMRLLRWRVWVQEKLQPTEWQVTLLWAALAGFLGALSSLLFSVLAEGIHELLTGHSSGVVETMRLLPWWARIAVPATGGLLAGCVLLFGKRIARTESSTDYMEAIAIGAGNVPVRASLVKSGAALFSIASGGSIGREGPMVQLAAMLASLVGRWRKFSPPQLRLLVACGAAAGIASAYNAPIAGSFFVAEIILGTIAMESLGPLAISAVVAALTVRVLTGAHQLYRVPPFQLGSPWEMGLYVLLGLLVGTLAPWFLRSLKRGERWFLATGMPPIARLVLGGVIVGDIAILVPEVCGNGYSGLVATLNGHIVVNGHSYFNGPALWLALFALVAAKWLATAASFGSGAPGGVFTPSLFMGAGTGYLFGLGLHAIWPSVQPTEFALVGMGAFLAAASHAPVMAIIMLFEMTLSYDIILPLMLCSVVAFYTAKGLDGRSLYTDALLQKSSGLPPVPLAGVCVRELMKLDPPVLAPTARFAEVAACFLKLQVNNLYVTDAASRFLGAVALHDIKPYLAESGVVEAVLARDILREDFPRIGPDATLSDALTGFLGRPLERLPVVDPADGRLLGSLAKNDLLLDLVETRKKPTP